MPLHICRRASSDVQSEWLTGRLFVPTVRKKLQENTQQSKTFARNILSNVKLEKKNMDDTSNTLTIQ